MYTGEALVKPSGFTENAGHFARIFGNFHAERPRSMGFCNYLRLTIYQRRKSI